jgi:hypothetical protein
LTTAQVEAWVSTRKGSIDKASSDIDASFADAALGRMMLHRRRAVAAAIVGAFFARTGGGSAAYMEGGEHPMLLDAAGERAIAAELGGLVARLCGTSPPLLFERAMLAREENRLDDAMSDVKRVVAAYPGFVPAAIAAGRMALAAGDPAEAIHSLAAVERELTHIREGAALLADSARAVGLHEAASRYDVVVLVSRGAYDSRGNDCAPVDLVDEIADDGRMPQTLYLESQADGSAICNAGGIYYTIHPLVGYLLAAWTHPRVLSTMRSLGPSGRKPQKQAGGRMAAVPTARLRLFFLSHFPNTSTWVRRHCMGIAPILRRSFARAAGLSARVDLAIAVLLYGIYRRLPVSIRSYANRAVRLQLLNTRSRVKGLRPMVRDRVGPLLGPRGNWGIFSRVSNAEAHKQLAQARYRWGIARIFGLRPLADSPAVTLNATRLPVAGLFQNSTLPTDDVSLEMPPPGKLPPLAEDTLRRLMSEAVIGRIGSPQS